MHCVFVYFCSAYSNPRPSSPVVSYLVDTHQHNMSPHQACYSKSTITVKVTPVTVKVTAITVKVSHPHQALARSTAQACTQGVTWFFSNYALYYTCDALLDTQPVEAQHWATLVLQFATPPAACGA